MARIPVRLDPTSTAEKQVTVIFYVDGKEFTQETYRVQEFAIPYVVAAACVQVEDPDYDAAIEDAKGNDDALPTGF